MRIGEKRCLTLTRAMVTMANMKNHSTLIIPFAKKINHNLNSDLIKKDWEKSDYWWLFTRMAQEINAMDKAMMNKENPQKVEEKAASVACFAIIIAKQYSNTIYS